MLLFTVALYYWRVAASLDVWEQSPPPGVRHSMILVVDIVLHLTKSAHHHHHDVPPDHDLLTSSCQQVYTS